jgi:two-component system, OmpR family, sensor histidine kinase TorS
LAKLHVPGFRSELIGKLLLVFGSAALLTVVIAAVAWISFKEVAGTQARIVDEAIPTMEAVQRLSTNIARIVALVEQLPVVGSRNEAERIASALSNRLEEMQGTLDRFELHHVDDAQSQNLRATSRAIDENLKELVRGTEVRLDLEHGQSEGLQQQRAAVKALLELAESMVANASATTTANVANLYRLVERGSGREALYESMDRMIEVDIDAMERMSEFQLVCVKIQTVLDQLAGEQDARAVPALAELFQTHLGTLKRRLDDIRDPSLKKAGLGHYQTLVVARAKDGIFSGQGELIAQLNQLQSLRANVGQLVFKLNEQASALVATGGKSIDVAGKAARGAVDRGLLGFLTVAILLLLALAVTVWVVFRYHLLGRLRGMERAVRALSTGNFDIELATTDNDPLAPLARAFEQVRENVRERERLEQELRRHHEELAEQVAQRTAELKESNALLEREVAEHAMARQQAEAANAAKNMFLGSLSHELRTPLSGVRGATQLLRETRIDARQADYLNMIDYANSTLLEILEDMLSFSRIEAGKLDLQYQPFALRQALEDMLSLQSVPAQGKGIALINEVSAALPPFVVGDRGKLNQLLLNIIGNAIKFTDEGTVTLEVKQQATLANGKARLMFSVADTGIGIPEDKIAEVFRPFFQVEETAHQRHSGAGLGLAICQRIVEAMGGEIAIESRAGEGTRVSFYLDFETLAALPEQEQPEASGLREFSRPLTVLVVEDDKINRTVCARYLELLGHACLLAEDGMEALAVLARSADRIDAVLMDISLPGMSGLEVAEHLRTLDGGKWSRLPIIIMSAHVSAQTSGLLNGTQCAAFLGKPFSVNALCNALGGVVNPEVDSSGLPDASEAGPGVLDIAFLNAELESLGDATVAELLMLFKNELPHFFAEMDTYLVAGDWPALGARAHRLRSAAGNLGMGGVLGLARSLEMLAVAANPGRQEIGRVWGELKASCVNACEELYALLLSRSDGDARH